LSFTLGTANRVVGLNVHEREHSKINLDNRKLKLRIDRLIRAEHYSGPKQNSGIQIQSAPTDAELIE
jgi:hypothetical protein